MKTLSFNRGAGSPVFLGLARRLGGAGEAALRRVSSSIRKAVKMAETATEQSQHSVSSGIPRMLMLATMMAEQSQHSVSSGVRKAVKMAGFAQFIHAYNTAERAVEAMSGGER